MVHTPSVYLLIFCYLFNDVVTQNIWSKIVVLSMNNELEKKWNEPVFAQFKYFLGICLSKTTKTQECVKIIKN